MERATGSEPCTYCGCPADTVDHVPPRSVRPILMQEGAGRWPFLVVPACLECNSLLGDRQPWTVSGRKARIKELLKRRYSAYLRIPEWSDAELSDVNDRSVLGKHILEGIYLKKLTMSRLRW